MDSGGGEGRSQSACGRQATGERGRGDGPHGRDAADEGELSGGFRSGRDRESVCEVRGRAGGDQRLALRLAGWRIHAGHQEGVSIVQGPGCGHGADQRDSDLPRRPYALWRGEGLRPRPRRPPLRHQRDDRDQAAGVEPLLTLSRMFLSRHRHAALASVWPVLCRASVNSVWAGARTWTGIGPEGGDIRVLAIDPKAPESLYAGTEDGGIFKSSNGGASWKPLKVGLPAVNVSVYALAFDPAFPRTIYAGIKFYGLFKSTDSGESWTAANTGLPRSSTVNALAIASSLTETVYAATFGGLFKSTNGGKSWSTVSAALPRLQRSADVPVEFKRVTILAVDSTNPTTLYTGTDADGVFKSTTAGREWKSANTGLPKTHVNALAIDLRAPATLYAGTDNGLFKSTNGGGNWTPVNLGLSRAAVPAYTVVIDPRDSRMVYTGTSGGLFRSVDGGKNWKPLNPVVTGFPIRALAPDPTSPNILYAGTLFGVLKSTTAGQSWSAVNKGLTNTFVETLVDDPTTPNTLSTWTRIGWTSGLLFRTTDGGKSWSPIGGGLPNTYPSRLVSDPPSPPTLYAGTKRNGPVQSTNGGRKPRPPTKC